MLIYSEEGRDVAMEHVVGVYLLEVMEDYVLIRLTGERVETMWELSNKYI